MINTFSSSSRHLICIQLLLFIKLCMILVHTVYCAIDILIIKLINHHFLYLEVSSELKSEKQGCFRAYFIEIRRLGSRANIFIHRSSPTFQKFLKWFYGFTPLNLGKVGLKSGNLLTFVHSLVVGVPWNWNILKIWSISESPLKSGLFSVSSAKIQPTAQISTPKLYCFWPNSTSGARYHKVQIS